MRRGGPVDKGTSLDASGTTVLPGGEVSSRRGGMVVEGKGIMGTKLWKGRRNGGELGKETKGSKLMLRGG